MEASMLRQADPFARLGLLRAFRVVEGDLVEAHRAASLRWHPDRFALAGEAARLQAEDEMALLNEAFDILKDPIRRAEALLTLEGFRKSETTDMSSSPEFLMEMMELKEQVAEDIRENRQEALKAKHQEMMCLEWDEIDRIKTAFDQLEAVARTDNDTRTRIFRQIRALLNQINYLRKTREEISRALI
ncbi:MAG: hypothetical protein DWQ01_03785 [Planctomycetota bacterium]|nr:MAG: hypothetical protein DWQ01_03785 [Planctomycetota bacterium]